MNGIELGARPAFALVENFADRGVDEGDTPNTLFRELVAMRAIQRESARHERDGAAATRTVLIERKDELDRLLKGRVPSYARRDDCPEWCAEHQWDVLPGSEPIFQGHGGSVTVGRASVFLWMEDGEAPLVWTADPIDASSPDELHEWVEALTLATVTVSTAA